MYDALQKVENEKLEYKYTNFIIYALFAILIIISLPFILSINTNLTYETLTLLGQYLSIQIKILFMVIAFTILGVYDRYNLSLTAITYYIPYLIGLVLIVVVTLIFDTLMAPLIIADIFLHDGTNVQNLFQDQKELLITNAEVLQYPLAFIVCFIPAKIIKLYQPSTVKYIIHMIFSFLIVKVILFNFPDYGTQLKANLSDLFIIDYIHLEIFQWVALSILILKNLYIYYNESKQIQFSFSQIKWIVTLGFIIIILNGLKTVFMVTYQPEFMLTIFIVGIVWFVTLAYENLNISLSSILNNDFPSHNTMALKLIKVFFLFIVPLAIYFYYFNQDIQSPIILILFSMYSLLFLYLFLKHYTYSNSYDRPEIGVFKVLIYISIGFFLIEYIENLYLSLFTWTLSIFFLNYFIRFFSLKEIIVMVFFTLTLITTNDYILHFLIQGKEFIGSEMISEYFSEVFSDAMLWYQYWFNYWIDNSFFRSMSDAYQDGNFLLVIFALAGYLIYIFLLLLATPIWLILATLRFIVIFIIGLIGSIFLLIFLLLKLLLLIIFTFGFVIVFSLFLNLLNKSLLKLSSVI